MEAMMSGRTVFIVVLAILAIGTLVGVGVWTYDAGVAQGIAESTRVAGGGQVTQAYPYPYYGPWVRPWGFGFGFLGILFPILFFFLIFSLFRALWWRSYGGWHGGYRGDR